MTWLSPRQSACCDLQNVLAHGQAGRVERVRDLGLVSAKGGNNAACQTAHARSLYRPPVCGHTASQCIRSKDERHDEDRIKFIPCTATGIQL